MPLFCINSAFLQFTGHRNAHGSGPSQVFSQTKTTIWYQHVLRRERWSLSVFFLQITHISFILLKKNRDESNMTEISVVTGLRCDFHTSTHGAFVSAEYVLHPIWSNLFSVRAKLISSKWEACKMDFRENGWGLSVWIKQMDEQLGSRLSLSEAGCVVIIMQ